MVKENRTYIGFVDQIDDMGIGGWAKAKESEEPIKVSLKVEGKILDSTIAKEVRKDIIIAKIHPKGTCGYFFDLEGRDIDLSKVEVVCEPEQVPLKKTAVAIPTYNVIFREPLFFLHIPKTAGSSFRRMLEKVTPQSITYPNRKELRDKVALYYDYRIVGDIERERLEKTMLFLGHYPYKVLELMPSNVKTIVFFREPIERAISDLFFLRKEKQLENQSLESFFDKEINHFDNLHVRFLSDTPTPLGNIVINDDLLQQAKNNLDKCFCLGLLEEFKRSINLMNTALNIDLGQVVRTNVNKTKKKRLISDELMEKIIAYNQFDKQLYEYAKLQFQLKCEKYHV